MNRVSSWPQTPWGKQIGCISRVYVVVHVVGIDMKGIRQGDTPEQQTLFIGRFRYLCAQLHGFRLKTVELGLGGFVVLLVEAKFFSHMGQYLRCERVCIC